MTAADQSSNKAFTFGSAQRHLVGIIKFLSELISSCDRARGDGVSPSATVHVARSYFEKMRDALQPLAQLLTQDRPENDATEVRNTRVFREAIVMLTEFLDTGFDEVLRRVEQLDLLGLPIPPLDRILRHHTTHYQLAALRNDIENLAGVRMGEPDYVFALRTMAPEEEDLSLLELIRRRCPGVDLVEA